MKKLYCKSVHRAGFEPASPKREQLKCSALDHSAIDANQNTVWTVLTSCPGQPGCKHDKVQLLSVFLKMVLNNLTYSAPKQNSTREFVEVSVLFIKEIKLLCEFLKMNIVPVKKPYPKSVHRAGFEPASPKREQLKCSALDHSAIDAIMILPAGLEPAALRLPCRRLSTHKSLMLCQTELRELCS